MILGLLLLLSCQNIEEVERPDDLIPEAKMVEILTDLSLLNSAKNYNKRLLEETGFRPDEYLYNKHNIDSARLAESTRYYARNSTEFESIYRKVQNNLNRMRDNLEKVQAEEERIKDSIKALEPEADSLVKDSVALKRIPDSLIMERYKPSYENEN